MSLIIAMFPGTGKDEILNHPQLQKFYIADLGTYDGVGLIHYMKNIELHQSADLILVSSHPDVRAALKADGLHYKLVYPNISQKEVHINERIGNELDTVAKLTMEETWDTTITTIEKETFPELVRVPGTLPPSMVVRWLTINGWNDRKFTVKTDQPPAFALEATEQVLSDVLKERIHQVTIRGFTPEHDAQFTDKELTKHAIHWFMTSLGLEAPESVIDERFPIKQNVSYETALIKGIATLVSELERVTKLSGR